MPKFAPISRQRHGDQRWLRYTSYEFAAGDTVAPLVAAELPKAVMSLPTGFIAVGGNFTPVAITGLAPGRNLLVAPDGRWLAAYVPALYRGHPFQLARTPDGHEVLCVDEDSLLLTEGPGGEDFFGENGELSPALTQVLEFLGQTSANRRQTQTICAALARHGIVQPWPIVLKSGESEQKLEGLYRIDEAAFNALSAEAILELHADGALPIIYCQLLSMQHLGTLGRLAEARNRTAAAVNTRPGFELDPLAQEETLNFE